MREQFIIPIGESYPGEFIDTIRYRSLLAVEPYSGFCGTGCVMGILNFFWGTTYGTKDTLDMITMIAGQEYLGNKTVDEAEILTFLARLGFRVTWAGLPLSYFSSYITDPVGTLRDYSMVAESNIDYADSVSAYQQLIQHPQIKIDETNIISLSEYIAQYQQKQRVFLIGCDRYILSDRERESDDPAGHLILSPGLDESTGEIIVCDPGPYVHNNRHMPVQRLEQAIRYSYGGRLTCMMIEYPRWADLLAGE